MRNRCPPPPPCGPSRTRAPGQAVRMPSYHAMATRCATISAIRTLELRSCSAGEAVAGLLRYPAIERPGVRDFIVGEQSRARLDRQRRQEHQHAGRTDRIVARARVRLPATQVVDHCTRTAQERRGSASTAAPRNPRPAEIRSAPRRHSRSDDASRTTRSRHSASRTNQRRQARATSETRAAASPRPAPSRLRIAIEQE